MKESRVVSYYEEYRSSLSALSTPDLDTKKVISYTHKIFEQGGFENVNESVRYQEFVATLALVALIAEREGKLKLCGDAYEILIYLCMKTNTTIEINRFLQSTIEKLPIEVFEGVLRGLAAYDLETNTDEGKKLLRSILQGRSIEEVERKARWETFKYWFTRVIKYIKIPLCGAVIGLLLGQIISNLLFK